MLYDIVVAGGSRGGVHALAQILAGLPRDFQLPLIVTLHRGPDSGDALVRKLAAAGPLPVAEAADKDRLVAGRVHVAPPGYHLLVEAGYLALSNEDPVSLARPSIDVLFESAADAYGERAVAVLLSGASSDGARGLARVRARAGLTVVQDPETAEARIMPEAALRLGPVDHVLPLSQIALLLARLGARRR